MLTQFLKASKLFYITVLKTMDRRVSPKSEGRQKWISKAESNKMENIAILARQQTHRDDSRER